MMKGVLRNVVIPIMGVLVVIVLVYLSPHLGLSTDIQTDLVDTLPGIILFAIGCSMLVMTGVSEFAIAGFGVLGVGLAILVGQMNTTGMVIPEFLTTTLTIEQIQSFIILIHLLIGGVVSAYSVSRR